MISEIITKFRTIERYVILKQLPFDSDSFTRRFIAVSASIVRELGYQTTDQNWHDEKFVNECVRKMPCLTNDRSTLYWLLDMQTPKNSQLPDTSRALVLNWNIQKKEFDGGLSDPNEALEAFKKDYLNK